MAKKKHKKAKHNPKTKVVYKYHKNPKKHHKAKRRRNPRPSATGAMAGIQKALPMSLAVAFGLVASRMITHIAFAKQTGYVKGAIQAGMGIGLGLLGGMLFASSKEEGLGTGMMVGGLTAGLLTVADTATGGKYTLSDMQRVGTRTVYLPATTRRLITAGKQPSNISGYHLQGIPARTQAAGGVFRKSILNR